MQSTRLLYVKDRHSNSTSRPCKVFKAAVDRDKTLPNQQDCVTMHLAIMRSIKTHVENTIEYIVL
jgi:hypothetical protein